MKKIIWFLLLCILLISCNDTMTFYTVTFDSDGGSEVPKQEVLEGKTAVEPKSPTKNNGDVFASWELEGGGNYNFSNPVTKDITLKAKYTPAEEVAKTNRYLKIDAQKIYDIAEHFISETLFSNNVSGDNVSSDFNDKTNVGDLVIEALNLETHKATTYILLKDNLNNNITNITVNDDITQGEEYKSSDYNITIKTASLEKSEPTKDEENNSYNIKLTNLKLSVKYEKKNDGNNNIITLEQSSSTTQTVTFSNVDIKWTETTENGENYINKGTIKMTVYFGNSNNTNNNSHDYTLSFAANGQGLLTATYGNQYLIF